MSPPPLLTLADISLTFGGDPLFTNVSLAIGRGERLCLVGRNGSGKSTLLKIAAGLVQPDSGERFAQPGVSIAYLPQEPDLSGFATLGEYAAVDIDPAEFYKVEMAMEGVQIRPDAPTATASGGERRRAALARMIVAEPDLMLIDEPTNHLDITAISWLEEYLAQTRAGFVLISHDRAFLERLGRGVIWLDRGAARRMNDGFAGFETWRDKIFGEEEQARHKLDRLIKAEGRWAVEGISARRKRNQGRVRRLADLRQTRAEQIVRTGVAKMELESGRLSGRLAVEAKSIAKRFGDRVIAADFSTRIMRGDRVALVGPNGVGKTTLLNILIGEDAPDSGVIRLGTNLEIARFDQNRALLDPALSLWETLTGDLLTGVRGSNDQVMVRGRPKHVVGYLKEFLFDEVQARGPVSALSGGERARLLLARIMARESNFLVLDEPTNDLDLETLDLLQELIADFNGTVLLVSHDRDFLDRVATSVIAMEGDGEAVEYPGGWSDYRRQRAATAPIVRAAAPRTVQSAPDAPRHERFARKLSFKQAHRLSVLPVEMERLRAEMAKLEAFLSDPELFAREPKKFHKATEGLAERQTALAAAEEEWLELEMQREEIGG